MLCVFRRHFDMIFLGWYHVMTFVISTLRSIGSTKGKYDRIRTERFSNKKEKLKFASYSFYSIMSFSQS